jgi:ADP-ribosylglycohydrolase
MRYKKILIGGAIGDAIGAFYEGSSIPIWYEENDNWRLTDDTQLTLATCEAIIQEGSPTPQAIAQSFKNWHIKRKINRMGASTLKALNDLVMGIGWEYSGRQSEYAAGNGAAMRIAPVTDYIDINEWDDRRLVHDICSITHKNDEAYCGALAIISAIQEATTNSKYFSIRMIASQLPDSTTKDALNTIVGINENIGQVAHKTGNSGYVAESVPLAIYAAKKGLDIGYKRAIIEIVCCGGDTDTIASMAGQIMGAMDLEIPEEWITKLPVAQYITELGTALEKHG